MWIVYIGGDKHSAWETIREAKNQKRVLIDYGYKDISFEYDKKADYPNGYYFV